MPEQWRSGFRSIEFFDARVQATTARRTIMISIKYLRLLALPAFGALVLSGSLAARADVVSDWNAKAEAIAVEKKLLPPPNARMMALVHVAMFEAVNAIDRRYAPYGIKLEANKSASREIAASAAAYKVLVTLHPDQKASLDTALAVTASAVPEGEAKTKSIELGSAAAAQVLALRAKDAEAAESYRPYTAAGVYVPTVVPLSSTYGQVSPWVMQSGAQFRPAAPPALTSETWTKDVNESREIGSRNSAKRSAEQTAIARFWFVTGPQTWNPVVRQLAVSKKLDLIDSARLFALVAMAADDAFIAVFDAKYHYNLWRPVTAIRNADLTKNPKTQRDANWLPLGETPMHPEYPCAHCITNAAVTAVLRSVFGEEIPEVSMTSATAPGVTRKWTRLQDITDEVSAARIYAGFHYRFSTKVGEDMGRKIGELTLKTQLRAQEASALPRATGNSAGNDRNK
jgi:hypothetical protein